jgi:hypothetical protein
MALIKCHECGNDVSTQAAACPRCGAPPLPPVIQTPPPVIPAYPPSPVPKPKRSFLLICIVLLFGGLVVVFVAIAIADALATKSQDAAKPVQPAASAVVKSTPSPVIPPPTAPTWDPAAVFTNDAVKPLYQIVAKRADDGGIRICGKANLPEKTKLGISLVQPWGEGNEKLLGESDAAVNAQGDFQSGGFTDHDIPYPEGDHTVHIYTYFNQAWQSSQILALLGTNGSRLPVAVLKLDDPEFPKQGGHIDQRLVLAFPGLSPAQKALTAVKEAKLFVQGHGQATDSVHYIVKFMQNTWAKTDPRAFQEIDWSAAADGPGKWIVTLNCYNDHKTDKAQWSYSEADGSVKYLDPLAKLLSYLPPE